MTRKALEHEQRRAAKAGLMAGMQHGRSWWEGVQRWVNGLPDPLGYPSDGI